MLGKSVNPLGWVHAFGHKPDTLPEGIHATDHRKHPVGLGWRSALLAMKLGYPGARQLVGLDGAKLGFHDALKQVTIERRGSALALGLNVLGEEPVSQFRNSRRGTLPGLFSGRVLAVCDCPQNGFRSLSGGFRG